MIVRLCGVVEEIGANFAVVDVGGMGHRVECSARTLRDMKTGGEVALTTELFFQDDRLRLYGFSDAAERDWFLLLLEVKGIGARMALTLLGVLAPPELAHVLASEDAKRLITVPGVGKRLAQRIVVELKDKAASVAQSHGVEMPAAAQDAVTASEGEIGDALQALLKLGYNRTRAQTVLAQVAQLMREEGGVADAANLVRSSLRLLGKS